MCRVLCDTRTARLARLLIKLRYYLRTLQTRRITTKGVLFENLVKPPKAFFSR
jgi:hypothetical protein